MDIRIIFIVASSSRHFWSFTLSLHLSLNLNTYIISHASFLIEITIS